MPPALFSLKIALASPGFSWFHTWGNEAPQGDGQPASERQSWAGAHHAEAELSAPPIQASGRSRTGWVNGDLNPWLCPPPGGLPAGPLKSWPELSGRERGVDREVKKGQRCKSGRGGGKGAEGKRNTKGRAGRAGGAVQGARPQE